MYLFICRCLLFSLFLLLLLLMYCNAQSLAACISTTHVYFLTDCRTVLSCTYLFVPHFTTLSVYQTLQSLIISEWWIRDDNERSSRALSGVTPMHSPLRMSVTCHKEYNPTKSILLTINMNAGVNGASGRVCVIWADEILPVPRIYTLKT